MRAAAHARSAYAGAELGYPVMLTWLAALGLSAAADESCPNACSSHGVCFNGACTCETNYTGLDCSIRTCPNDCGGESNGLCMADGTCECQDGYGPLTPGGVNDCLGRLCSDCGKHGTCNYVLGECRCDEGWTGAGCKEQGCTNECSGHGVCNKDGPVAKCECDAGYAGADCATVSCAGDCSERGVCLGGVCRCLPDFTGVNCERKRCPDDCGCNVRRFGSVAFRCIVRSLSAESKHGVSG